MNSSFPLATIPLHQYQFPDSNELLRLLSHQPCLEFPCEGVQCVSGRESLTWDFEGVAFTIKYEDSPIPFEVLENRCILSGWWRDALPYLRDHSGRLVLSVSCTEKSFVENAVLLTRATLATLELVEAPGVYWGDGILHCRKSFMQLASLVAFERLVANLWVNINALEKEDGSFCLSSFGLADFHHHDIEISDFQSENPGAVVGFACALIENSLLGGDDLKVGSKFNATLRKILTIEIGASFMNPRDEVLQIRF